MDRTKASNVIRNEIVATKVFGNRIDFFQSLFVAGGPGKLLVIAEKNFPPRKNIILEKV